jgi:hypothetical protein
VAIQHDTSLSADVDIYKEHNHGLIISTKCTKIEIPRIIINPQYAIDEHERNIRCLM